MQMLSEAELLAKISAGEPFEAKLDNETLKIKIQEYVPYVCTAIHAGHQLRTPLEKKCVLDGPGRLLEEDPYTDTLIDSFPITLIPLDSRYEYDLNRPPETCVYETAWDKKVWSKPLIKKQQVESLEKHSSYYRILHAIINKINRNFGGCLVIDVHSYNWQTRNHDTAPVFNIGTEQLDVKRWQKLLSVFEKSLSAIKLPNLATDLARNGVFLGRGYQATYVRKHFNNVPLIPLEVKKIFMDETSGVPFPLVVEALQKGLHDAVLDVASEFNKQLSRSKLKRKDLLPSEIDPALLKVDKALYKFARGLNTINYINPLNLQHEKRQFFSKHSHDPLFRYRQLRVDPYHFREQLYKLPVSKISDPSIRELYRAIVDSYATKIELITHIGTPQFHYNSLRYYGEPSTKDIANARFLLHAGQIPNAKIEQPNIDAADAKIAFEEAVKAMGYDCKVVLSTRIVAKAMVNNTRKILLVNKSMQFTQLEIHALIHHELGVHMATSLNAENQPLHVLRMGLPGNTYTQEGLAILSEYLSGHFNLERLQELALRVLAIHMMIDGMNFRSTFNCLKEEYGLSDDSAFGLTARVFRGGGFTKDYLYLRGFRDMVKLFRTRDITALYTGKTSAKFIDTLDDLTRRGILSAPQHIPEVITKPHDISRPVMDYLVNSIR